MRISKFNTRSTTAIKFHILLSVMLVDVVQDSALRALFLLSFQCLEVIHYRSIYLLVIGSNHEVEVSHDENNSSEDDCQYHTNPDAQKHEYYYYECSRQCQQDDSNQHHHQVGNHQTWIFRSDATDEEEAKDDMKNLHHQSDRYYSIKGSVRYVNTIRGWVFSICQLLAIVFHEHIKLPVGQIVKGENRVKYTVNGCNGGYDATGCPPADPTAR